MANEKRLIDAAELDRKLEALAKRYYEQGRMEAAKDYSFVQTVLLAAPTVDAVEVPDKDLLNAIKLLIKQYGHSKASEYVHSPVAHALFHTWKQLDARGYGKRRADNG